MSGLETPKLGSLDPLPGLVDGTCRLMVGGGCVVMFFWGCLGRETLK